MLHHYSIVQTNRQGGVVDGVVYNNGKNALKHAIRRMGLNPKTFTFRRWYDAWEAYDGKENGLALRAEEVHQ